MYYSLVFGSILLPLQRMGTGCDSNCLDEIHTRSTPNKKLVQQIILSAFGSYSHVKPAVHE